MNFRKGLIAAMVLAGCVAAVAGMTGPSETPALTEPRPDALAAGNPTVLLAQYNPCPRGKCR